MALRSEDLGWHGSARVYKFPPIRARRRAARLEVLRRRFALAAVGLVVVAAGLLATGPQGVAPAGTKTGRAAVRIGAGETLWDVAARHAPSGIDTRAYLDAILELNGIGVVVDPGTRIRLP